MSQEIKRQSLTGRISVLQNIQAGSAAFVLNWRNLFDDITHTSRVTDFNDQGSWLTLNVINLLPTYDGSYNVRIFDVIETQATWDDNPFYWNSPDIYWDDIVASVQNELLTSTTVTITGTDDRDTYISRTQNHGQTYLSADQENGESRYLSASQANDSTRFVSSDQDNDGVRYNSDNTKARSNR